MLASDAHHRRVRPAALMPDSQADRPDRLLAGGGALIAAVLFLLLQGQWFVSPCEGSQADVCDRADGAADAASTIIGLSALLAWGIWRRARSERVRRWGFWAFRG